MNESVCEAINIRGYKKKQRKDMKKDKGKHNDVGNVEAQSYRLQIYQFITRDTEKIYTDRTDKYRVLQSKWAQIEI